MIASLIGSAFVDRSARLEARAERRIQMLPILAELEFRWNRLDTIFDQIPLNKVSAPDELDPRLAEARAILRGAGPQSVSDPKFINVHAGALVSRLDGLAGAFAAPPMSSRLSSALLWVDDRSFKNVSIWKAYVKTLGRFVQNRMIAIQQDVVPVDVGTTPNCELFSYLNLNLLREPNFSQAASSNGQIDIDCEATKKYVADGVSHPPMPQY
tara:strand:+ start:385 stop:1020 length:636 start_codon:yes stop_codon:yes gene_type:complete